MWAFFMHIIQIQNFFLIACIKSSKFNIYQIQIKLTSYLSEMKMIKLYILNQFKFVSLVYSAVDIQIKGEYCSQKKANYIYWVMTDGETPPTTKYTWYHLDALRYMRHVLRQKCPAFLNRPWWYHDSNPFIAFGCPIFSHYRRHHLRPFWPLPALRLRRLFSSSSLTNFSFTNGGTEKGEISGP